jgi:hypothetical protein
MFASDSQLHKQLHIQLHNLCHREGDLSGAGLARFATVIPNNRINRGGTPTSKFAASCERSRTRQLKPKKSSDPKLG